jgi:hypothetical protein
MTPTDLVRSLPDILRDHADGLFLPDSDTCQLLRRAASLIEAQRGVVEAAELAEREMALLMGDYHAPAYKGMDLIRQIQPFLRQALNPRDVETR